MCKNELKIEIEERKKAKKIPPPSTKKFQMVFPLVAEFLPTIPPPPYFLFVQQTNNVTQI